MLAVDVSGDNAEALAAEAVDFVNKKLLYAKADCVAIVAAGADTDNDLAAVPENLANESFMHIAVKAPLEVASLATLHQAAELVRAGVGEKADGAPPPPPPPPCAGVVLLQQARQGKLHAAAAHALPRLRCRHLNSAPRALFRAQFSRPSAWRPACCARRGRPRRCSGRGATR